MIVQGLSAEDHERIARAIGAAERHTSGEIFAVIARSADDFRFVPMMWALLFAFALSWALLFATSLSTSAILLAQGIGFVAATALLSLPQLRYRVVPPVLARDAAHKAALAQFMAHGIHLTTERTGILIYVSMLPKCVEIVADSGIHAHVDPVVWEEAVGKIASSARAGKLADGLVVAIEALGALLATHFPRTQKGRNELPDRVVEV